MKTFSSFSGADLVATITFPQLTKAYVIGELSTISYSTHREINPVRTLGRINPSGFCRGSRTIGGSLIFTVFDESVIRQFQRDLSNAYQSSFETVALTSAYQNDRFVSTRIKDIEKILADEMPPFDITISFGNEMGSMARTQIYGVLIMNEGQVMSVNDVYTESTMNFIAQNIESMKAVR